MRACARKNAKATVLYEGQFIRLIRKDEWEYVERHNCSGIVIIIAMTDDNEVIFVEQFRPPVGKNVIEFPAGLVNDRVFRKKESLLEAAKRELVEETGYEAKKVVKVLEGPVSGGVSADMVTIVRASGLRKIGEGGGDETELITVHKVPLDKADQWLRGMAKKGRLIEPKIYTGLYFLQNPRAAGI